MRVCINCLVVHFSYLQFLHLSLAVVLCGPLLRDCAQLFQYGNPLPVISKLKENLLGVRRVPRTKSQGLWFLIKPNRNSNERYVDLVLMGYVADVAVFNNLLVVFQITYRLDYIPLSGLLFESGDHIGQAEIDKYSIELRYACHTIIMSEFCRPEPRVRGEVVPIERFAETRPILV